MEDPYCLTVCLSVCIFMPTTIDCLLSRVYSDNARLPFTIFYFSEF